MTTEQDFQEEQDCPGAVSRQLRSLRELIGAGFPAAQQSCQSCASCNPVNGVIPVEFLTAGLTTVAGIWKGRASPTTSGRSASSYQLPATSLKTCPACCLGSRRT